MRVPVPKKERRSKPNPDFFVLSLTHVQNKVVYWNNIVGLEKSIIKTRENRIKRFEDASLVRQ
jgi:hypothetical protein